MAPRPPLQDQEVRRILRVLQPAVEDQRIVLVGGQAVAFWQRYLQPYSKSLELLDVVTSKDIDFEGSARAVARAAELLAGEARFPDPHHVATPNTGIVLYRDSHGVRREIDFIAQPLGLDARDVRQTGGRATIGAVTLDHSHALDALLGWIDSPVRATVLDSKANPILVLNGELGRAPDSADHPADGEARFFCVGHDDPRDGADGFFLPSETFRHAMYPDTIVGVEPRSVLHVFFEGGASLVVEHDPQQSFRGA